MKKLGVGYENYKDFFDKNLYLVDKTLLIRDILEKGGKVTLVTRPRRFGKTLALSMLRTFFELEYDLHGNIIDKGKYFKGMKTTEAGDHILKHMGQYPVINMTLKSAKQPDFYAAFLRIREDIIREFSRHRYLLDSDLLDTDKKSIFHEYLSEILPWEKKSLSKEERDAAFHREVAKFSTALRLLSDCLYLHHGKKIFIFLDEYDVPLENSYFRGFYPEMVDFIRSLFESALKTNDALERAVITGCLRISKESIFTGLNHLSIISIRSKNFAEDFGFTQAETDAFLAAYGLEAKRDEVMQWYDGYLFGQTEIYNPWSVVKYIDRQLDTKDALPEPYWANTSSNTIIKELVETADADTRSDYYVSRNKRSCKHVGNASGNGTKPCLRAYQENCARMGP